MKRARAAARRGLASMWAVVILATLSILTAAIIAQMVAGRRVLDRRERQVQAAWLARAGAELASARLLSAPDGYEGESLELVPGSRVRVEVRGVPDAPNTYQVTSEARCPADGADSVARSVTRRLRRVADKEQVRIEVVTAPAP